MASHDDDDVRDPLRGSTEQNEPPTAQRSDVSDDPNHKRDDETADGTEERIAGLRDHRHVVLRDVAPDELAGLLRSILGLPAEARVYGEEAASVRRSMPVVFYRLDVGGWIAWCLAGLGLFSGRFPSMPRVRAESKRIVAGLAMLRAGGNMSDAARALGISRKVLRDNLRAVGLYPWCSKRGEERSDGA